MKLPSILLLSTTLFTSTVWGDSSSEFQGAVISNKNFKLTFVDKSKLITLTNKEGVVFFEGKVFPVSELKKSEKTSMKGKVFCIARYDEDSSIEKDLESVAHLKILDVKEDMLEQDVFLRIQFLNSGLVLSCPKPNSDRSVTFEELQLALGGILKIHLAPDPYLQPQVLASQNTDPSGFCYDALKEDVIKLMRLYELLINSSNVRLTSLQVVFNADESLKLSPESDEYKMHSKIIRRTHRESAAYSQTIQKISCSYFKEKWGSFSCKIALPTGILSPNYRIVENMCAESSSILKQLNNGWQ